MSALIEVMIKLSFILIAIGVFWVFSRGVSRVVFGGDSGDIILAYYFGGVAHPPGYPLNTLLGFILTKVLPGATFAYRANMVSAIYQAISIGLLYFLLYRLTRNRLIALSGSLTLAFVPLFWLYAHVAEVFQLNILLILSSLISLFKFWSSQKKKDGRFLMLSVFFWGLAVFHHQTSLLLAPAYLFVLVKNRKYFSKFSEFLPIIGAFFAGVIPYLFVFWAASRQTPINWDDPSTFAGFWKLITRADYGTFTAARDLVGFSIQARLVQVLWYFKVVLADFTLFGVLFILSGLVWLVRHNKDWFWFFVLSAFFSGPFFLAYASFPPVEALLLGISERFLLLNYVFLAILLTFGMFFSVNFVSGLLSKLTGRKKLIGLTCSLALLLMPMTFFLLNLPKADLRDFRLGEVLAHDVLFSASPPGIIFLQGDTLTFNTQYSYWAEGINKDSSIIMTGRLRHISYRKQVIREYPALALPEKFDSDKNLEYADTVIGLIDSNFGNVPIYSFSPVAVGEDYVWVSWGMLKRLYKKDNLPKDEEITANVNANLLKLKFKKELISGRYMNFFDENIKNTYAGVFVDNAFELLRRGAIESAKRYFELAISLSPDNKSALFGLGVSYFEKGDCESSESVFRSIIDMDESYWQAWEGLGQVYKNCLGNESGAKEFLERSVFERKKQFDKPISDL